MEVYSLLVRAAEQYPDRPAIIDHTGQVTYSSLLALSEDLRPAFRELGVRAKRGVGLQVRNGTLFTAALFALSANGAVVVPLGSAGKNETMRLASSLKLHEVVSERFGDRAVPGHNLAVSALRDSPDEVFAPHVPDAAFVRPTSGTTGLSKGVVLSHRAVLDRVSTVVNALSLNEDDTITWILPMAYHFVASMLAYVKAGACTVVCPDSLAPTVIAHSNQYRSTIIYSSPAHYALLAADTSPARIDSLRLPISSSGALSPFVSERFQARFGLPIRQLYGIIEVGLPLGNLEVPPLPLESVGKPLPRYEAAILDEEGEECPDNVVGELGVRGPGMFDAYLDPQRMRSDVERNGWFLTGDLAVRDRAGVYTVVGRKKSVIITAGNKVFPEEVEHVLNEFPGVSSSRVYGKKHDYVGEIVSAEITLQNGPIALDELRKFCKERLSPYKAPQEIQVVSGIPLTNTGKVMRR